MSIIYENSSHLRSAHDNVKKHVGILNYLTIANTSYKNSFQYVSVPLTELINDNALTLATYLLIVLFKTVLVVSVPSLILFIAKFIDQRK